MEVTHNIQQPSVTSEEVGAYLKELDALAGTDKTVNILRGDGVNTTRYATVDAALTGSGTRTFVTIDAPDAEASASASTNAESVATKLSQPTTHKSVMFDMYALMELMQEMAQELRNAMRELRQTELSGIQANIQAQANAQLSGAIAQVAVGCVMSGIQLVVTTVGAAKMAGSYKGQMNTSDLKLQLDNAKADVKLATAGGVSTEAAELQVTTVARETGFSEETVLKMMPNASQAKSDFDIATGKTPVENETQRVAAYRRLINDDSAELPKVNGEVKFSENDMSSMRLHVFEAYENAVDGLLSGATTQIGASLWDSLAGSESSEGETTGSDEVSETDGVYALVTPTGTKKYYASLDKLNAHYQLGDSVLTVDPADTDAVKALFNSGLYQSMRTSIKNRDWFTLSLSADKTAFLMALNEKAVPTIHRADMTSNSDQVQVTLDNVKPDLWYCLGYAKDGLAGGFICPDSGWVQADSTGYLKGVLKAPKIAADSCFYKVYVLPYKP